jgi:hypothetical protein
LAPRVFLSYSRDDSKFTLKLAGDLKAAGVVIWLDQLIRPSVLWDVEVQEALTNSDFFVLILSKSSVKSTNVMDELSFALDEKKAVIPVRHRDCDIPFRLRRVQSIDFRKDYESGLQKLLTTLIPQQQDTIEDEVRRIRLMLLAAPANLKGCLAEAQALKEKHPGNGSVQLLYNEVVEAQKREQLRLHRIDYAVDEVQKVKKRPLTPRPSLSARWTAVSLGILLLAAVTYLSFRHLRGDKVPSSTTAAAPNPPSERKSTNILVQPEALPPVSTSKSSANGLAQPSWKDIESRVKSVYYSVAEMKKSGAFRCTNDRQEGYICRQDVEVTEQGADQTRTATLVAVFYKHTNGQWQFWKLEEQH